ncbi:DUF4397 domain-containing protein [Haloarculaceae archaeon H-GB2-1]|nr:DUF4397 domain-containing protein [Haloarculaceae archaeon H-GB1-1]MEA5389511.1 DUF4397 domain-containing protein [Haloarculaceae archaeon H-GB11]MEA5410035.1 DUF4397 domain-containing protein [Haloarculaceae archaeon H-GB2-1]
MSSNRLQKLLVAVLVTVLVAGGIGGVVTAQETPTPEAETPTENVTEAENRTQVRAVHVSPVVPSVDVFVDDEPIAQNLSFLEASEYEQVEPGDRDFRIDVNETEENIFETNASLRENISHTVVVVGTVTDNETVDFQPVLLGDEYVVPDENNASVRFVHTAPDVEAVDVTVQGSDTVVADNLTFRDDSPYVNVPAGNVTLEVREEEADNQGDVIATANFTLAGGTVYSTFGIGYQDVDDAPVNLSFDVAIIRDAGREADGNVTVTPTPAGTPTATPTPTETPVATPEEG